MKTNDIPLFILLMFTLVYSVSGDPSSRIWSGVYFLVNYITMFILFMNERSKLNRLTGMSLSVAILIFIVLKFFFNFSYERYYTLIPFFVSLYWIYKREAK